MSKREIEGWKFVNHFDYFADRECYCKPPKWDEKLKEMRPETCYGKGAVYMGGCQYSK